MSQGRRIYLDNAATSFPKPPGVYEAMVRYGTEVGASPGRGHYAESREGDRLIRQCRDRICRFINGESPEHVIFTLNTSDALNLAIKGVVRARRLKEPGRRVHVVTTAMDHNSVLRPLAALSEEGVEVSYVAADTLTGRVDRADVAGAIRPDTALVAVSAASNVSGTIQPVTEIGEACRARDVLYLVDAAQALGHLPLDVRAIHADLLAFPGHKGLLGPQGTGGLYIRPGVEGRVATTREGGTGSWSESDRQPDALPQRYEAGSHNTVGIVGLSEAVAWLLDRGIGSIRRHELDLIALFLDELCAGGCRMGSRTASSGSLGSLRLLGPERPEDRVGVFGFIHDTLSPAECAAILEQHFGILCRSGLTCAPRAHGTFGTIGPGAAGSFRLSIGAFTTREDVRHSAGALREVCQSPGACDPRGSA